MPAQLRTAVPGDPQAQPKPSERFPSKSRVQDFINTGTGEMQADDGTVFAFTTYKATDEVIVTMLHKELPSASRAQAQLATEVKKATKILERSQIRDNVGRVAGERVAAVIPTSDSTRPIQAILWTAGPHFYQIFSTSVQDNVKLEKQIKRGVD